MNLALRMIPGQTSAHFTSKTLVDTTTTTLTAGGEPAAARADGGAGRIRLPRACPVSHFFSRKTVILCMLVLAGCDCFFAEENITDTEESITSQRLKEMGVGEYKYLKEIYDGQWERVCIWPPYTGFGSDISKQFNLNTGESHWHLVFSKDNEFYPISFERSRKLDVKQKNFFQKQMDDFKKLSFSPIRCASFNRAAIFKFEDQRPEEDARTYIALGVMKQ